MNHVIIRTCPRDDYLSALCYTSFIESKINANFSFLADDSKNIKNPQSLYPFSNKCDIPFVYHTMTNNFSNKHSVNILLNSIFNNYTFCDEDSILLVDADLIVFDNFLHFFHKIDHGGTGGITNHINDLKLHHISNQMCYLSGSLINKLKKLSYMEINNIINDMFKNKIHVCDDTFLSFVSDLWNVKKLIINPKNYWRHHKAYHLTGMNFKDALVKLRKQENIL